MKSLAGRHYVISGASMGLGAAVARGLSLHHAAITLLARSEKAMLTVAADCERMGATAIAGIPVELGDDISVAGAIGAAVGFQGPIHGVVCAIEAAPTRAEWLTVAVDGSLRLLHASKPHLTADARLIVWTGRQTLADTEVPNHDFAQVRAAAPTFVNPLVLVGAETDDSLDDIAAHIVALLTA